MDPNIPDPVHTLASNVVSGNDARIRGAGGCASPASSRSRPGSRARPRAGRCSSKPVNSA